MKKIAERKKILSSKTIECMHDLFSNFEYDLNKTMDLSIHVLDTDEDTALEDSIPMHAFFVLCKANAETKEDTISEKLKIIEGGAIQNKDKKITQQKGEIRQTEEYKNWQILMLRYRKIGRNCEGMMKNMEMRLNSSQTRSVDKRPEQRNGVWNTKE